MAEVDTPSPSTSASCNPAWISRTSSAERSTSRTVSRLCHGSGCPAKTIVPRINIDHSSNEPQPVKPASGQPALKNARKMVKPAMAKRARSDCTQHFKSGCLNTDRSSGCSSSDSSRDRSVRRAVSADSSTLFPVAIQTVVNDSRPSSAISWSHRLRFACRAEAAHRPYSSWMPRMMADRIYWPPISYLATSAYFVILEIGGSRNSESAPAVSQTSSPTSRVMAQTSARRCFQMHWLSLTSTRTGYCRKYRTE